MAFKKSTQSRIQEMVAELIAEEERLDGRAENINDIEDAMIRIGDAVAQEFGFQKLALHTSRPLDDPGCPHCGRPGEEAEKQTRDLITRRGKVPVTETKYRCPKCRRLFSPSDDCLGT